ncbi:MAG: hypothetical protein FJ035_07280 [Chloroflexi bacterium]|nr:hypothetical protein [Chloroflexota bacterium]
MHDDAWLVDAVGRDTSLFVLGPERDVSVAELLERGVDRTLAGVTIGEPTLRTRATNMPDVLLELFYISNAQDAALLADEGARAAMARGITAGILRSLR